MQKPQGRGLCVAIEVLSVSALVAATGDGAMGLGKGHLSIGSGDDLRKVARAQSS
jgi:hypothetical protein